MKYVNACILAYACVCVPVYLHTIDYKNKIEELTNKWIFG